MIQLSKKYTFMEPEIACKETGFEGRSDIILYYDMLNRITNFSKLNELIKKAKNIEKKLNLLKLKKMQRFTRLGINAEKFYDEAATKSTFLYYLTEKSFNSLNLSSKIASSVFGAILTSSCLDLLAS